MDLLAILRRSGGIDALARQIDVAPAAALKAADALLPSLLSGLHDYAQRLGGGDAGIDALFAIIDGMGDGNLAVAVMGPGPVSADAGDRILAQVFGSLAAKERLADHAAQNSGEDAALLARALPILAMLVCGYMSARVNADPDDGEHRQWLRDLLALEGSPEPRSSSGTHG